MNIAEEDHPVVDNNFEEEEALSLRDFPVSNKEEVEPSPSPRKSSFSFEFLTDMTPICHAEDMFYSGKLVPLNQQSTLKVESFDQCGSESASKGRVVRNSRSFDERKVKRVSSMKRGEGPGWYIRTFGTVKYPREMELGDMKKRQVGGRSVKMFEWENEEEKCASKLIRVLSCKGRSSVSVRASFQATATL